jgi:hypothetical protein
MRETVKSHFLPTPARTALLAVRRLRPQGPGVVYGIKPVSFDYLKIGYCRDSYDRLKTLQVAWPIELQWVFKIAGDMYLEEAIQHELWPSRVRGDWFNYDASVREFVEILLAEFPAAAPWLPEKPDPIPICEHYVAPHGWRCEKCGLAAQLVSESSG